MRAVYVGFALLGIALAVASQLWALGAGPRQYLPRAASRCDGAVLLLCFSAIALVYQYLCNKRLWRLSPDVHRDFAPLILLLLIVVALDLVLLNLVAIASVLLPAHVDERACADFLDALGRWFSYLGGGITVMYCAALGYRYRRGSSLSASSPSGKAR